MIADDKMRVMVTMATEDVKRMDEYCKATGMTRSGFVNYVVKVAFGTADSLPDRLIDNMLRLAVSAEVSRQLHSLRVAQDDAGVVSLA